MLQVEQHDLDGKIVENALQLMLRQFDLALCDTLAIRHPIDGPGETPDLGVGGRQHAGVQVAIRDRFGGADQIVERSQQPAQKEVAHRKADGHSHDGPGSSHPHPAVADHPVKSQW